MVFEPVPDRGTAAHGASRTDGRSETGMHRRGDVDVDVDGGVEVQVHVEVNVLK
jgi:hypothetical protein